MVLTLNYFEKLHNHVRTKGVEGEDKMKVTTAISKLTTAAALLAYSAIGLTHRWRKTMATTNQRVENKITILQCLQSFP